METLKDIENKEIIDQEKNINNWLANHYRFRYVSNPNPRYDAKPEPIIPGCLYTYREYYTYEIPEGPVIGISKNFLNNYDKLKETPIEELEKYMEELET